jgi:NADH-quinone oxidoreductase subunit L
MEGPTPVSALIHAATMVTAGVYLVVRMNPVFSLAPDTLYVIGLIGAATALFAALCAVGQTDLKRVLAYSTVSQLGLMFLACGAGAYYAAMFHLTTHAFIKALLFLSAGNVIHMIHDTTEMGQMGGLSKIFTKTHWLFLIGVLALAGIPPLAAFFSKDLILDQTHMVGFHTLFYIGLAASILTAFYLTRAYCLTFMGPSRLIEKNAKSATEAPAMMLAPVTFLAVLAVIGGFLGYAFGKTPILESFLGKAGITLGKHDPNGSFIFSPETLMSVIGALLAIGLSAYLYTRHAERFRRPLNILNQAFYIDDFYSLLIVRPLKAVSRFIAYTFEPEFFDASIRSVVRKTQGTARWLQQVQSGQIRSYAAWMVVGTVILIAYFVF